MPSRIHPPAHHRADRGQRLSRRERRVLEWLAAGQAPQQVARRLGRPEGDVVGRLGALLARFGVHSAAEALAHAPAAADDDDEGDDTLAPDTASQSVDAAAPAADAMPADPPADAAPAPAAQA